MAQGRTRAYRDRLVRMLARGPQRPSELGWRSWLSVIRRTIVEFIDDDLNDRAAALTYFASYRSFPDFSSWSPALACSDRPQRPMSSTT